MATARPSKGRPRRTEAVKRLNFCSQPSCCGIRVRRLLDLRRVRRNIATSKLNWMRFEERLTMIKAKAKEAGSRVAKQS